jgi:sulfhydrogenase subunit beta (sulfur reductase)
MSFKVIPKPVISQWVEQLIAQKSVIGPKALQDRYIFDQIRTADELALNYTTTVVPAKKVYLPQREEILRFNMEDGTVEPVIEFEPTILFGVHTCDLHALNLLDRVFGQGYADMHYQTRREQTTLVSLECLTPCTEHSFCKSMGTLSVTEGFDLHLTDLGDAYAAEIGTEKGLALLEGLEGIQDAGDEDYRRLNQTLSDKWPNFPYRLESDVSELANLLSVSYDSDLWEELGEKCMACGSCTAVCPTCYCFNVEDEVDFTLTAGSRYREWDGCPLLKFAEVAGGHNFREKNAERQRHRFFRKGKYQMDAHSLVGCVGCGRCAQACLVNINPVDTFNELARRHIPMTRRQEEVM